MRPVSIRRSLGFGLFGLAVALAALAALGVAGLYDARQTFEDRSANAYELEASAARLLAASLLEESANGRSGAGARGDRRVAASVFDGEIARARTLARPDARSSATVRRISAAERRGQFQRVRSQSVQLGDRQAARRDDAREDATADTRRALATAAIAGLLALIAALVIIASLVGSMRKPLDELVGATRRVASGEPTDPLEPGGPRELRELGDAFNSMAEDLTGARQRIEAERLKLAVTVESLGDALVASDGEGLITLLNPRAQALLPELETGGRADDAGGPLPPLEAVLEHEVTVERDGRTIAITAAPIGRVGEGNVWTVRDISERARLERLKSEFVATASHELRSPLTSIKGFVELLARSPDLGSREREWAEVILLSTNRLVDLVNDLLDVARVEAGRLEIARRPTDVTEIVDEVATLLRPRIEDKDQDLVLDLPPGLPRAVADPSRLRQIVTNLLTNAHLYTEEGGRLEVRVAAERRSVRIEVEDSGRGMTEEEAAQIFERFYRGSERTAGAPGSGLGLSIVKSLVDLQGGSVTVESEPRVGTVFTVKLPLEPRPGDDEAPRLALQGRRVLVVDDEPDIAALIASQLEPFEVEAVIAHTGAEALELLRNEDFDAVTLDILMPGMSGFELLHTLRSDDELRRTPVVVVSVFSGRQALAGEWTVGKPIDSGELADALGSAVLAGRTAVLVVGRPSLREVLVPTLKRVGLDHEWVTSGGAAARACRDRRFEVALVDAGMRSPRAALEGLELRGRRHNRAVVIFTSGENGESTATLDPEPVPLEEAAATVVEILRSGG